MLGCFLLFLPRRKTNISSKSCLIVPQGFSVVIAKFCILILLDCQNYHVVSFMAGINGQVFFAIDNNVQRLWINRGIILRKVKVMRIFYVS